MQELRLQPRHCASSPGKAGPKGNTELPGTLDRVTAQNIGTPWETTLLQAQFSLGTIKTRLEGTACQAAHPLPHSRISCPFDLNSLGKVISAALQAQAAALPVPGERLQTSRLAANHRTLDASTLMG